MKTNIHGIHKEATSRHTKIQLINPKILVVDDEADTCEAFNNYFTRKGFSVITAMSGAEGLYKLSEEKPDLVILDIRLPDIDGIECLRMIRDLGEKALIIMSTCITDENVAREALELGAVDYITKPLDLETIHIAILCHLLQNRPK